MKLCEVVGCNNEAIYKVYGGKEMKPPGAWTDAVPFPENFSFRCQEHQSRPEAPFGKLWMWYPKDRFPHLFN